MDTTHTPAPWIIQPSSKPLNGILWRDIVSTGGEFSPTYVGEALESDARLIAAAPDMLTLLCDVSSWLEFHLKHGAIHADTANRDGDLVSQLRDVIAKATTASNKPESAIRWRNIV